MAARFRCPGQDGVAVQSRELTHWGICRLSVFGHNVRSWQSKSHDEKTLRMESAGNESQLELLLFSQGAERRAGVKHRELKHFAAMMLIGDGVMALVRPRQDAAAWKHGPISWRKSMKLLQRNPAATRLVAAAQIAGALWWVLHEETSVRSELAA